MADVNTNLTQREIEIPVEDEGKIRGTLNIAEQSNGIVIFAHGSGSSRFSPRNRFVAGELQKKGFATLLLDLLTGEEENIDLQSRDFRFDIELLTGRLMAATKWSMKAQDAGRLPIGFFGASTGAAAALCAAAEFGPAIKAVVSRGGRADMAINMLPRVTAPTLLIVGGSDIDVIKMNRQAAEYLKVKKELVIVPGASHLFEERGALEKVAQSACDWFVNYLPATEKGS
jgi:pimeloyl-ACP methyl ester carboxylesterase